APALHDVGRNLLHNGLFNVAQRGAGNFTLTGARTWTADRWWGAVANADASTVSIQTLSDANRAQIGEEAGSFQLQVIVPGSATAGSYTKIGQNIENVRSTANKTVTVSFWAGSSINMTIGVGLGQITGTGGSPSAPVYLATQQVAVGSPFARYSVTFTVPSLS